jgi:creatinine amidohydrolase
MYMIQLTMQGFQELPKTMDTIIIPIGMIEAHGPHCSLGTDLLIPREFIRRLELQLGERLLVAPEISYGHSWGLKVFPGTIDIAAEPFVNYVYEVAKGFVLNGFRYIILFNGHGGNMAGLNLVSEKVADLGAFVLSMNWWLDYRETIRQFTPETGHAGEDETSVLLAIDPSLVDSGLAGSHKTAIPANLRLPDGGKFMYPQAFSGNAGAASALKGQKIMEALTPLMLKDIQNMWEHGEKINDRGV